MKFVCSFSVLFVAELQTSKAETSSSLSKHLNLVKVEAELVCLKRFGKLFQHRPPLHELACVVARSSSSSQFSSGFMNSGRTSCRLPPAYAHTVTRFPYNFVFASSHGSGLQHRRPLICMGKNTVKLKAQRFVNLCFTF